MRLIQPFVNVLILTVVGVVQLLVGLDVQGQEIPRDEYLRYIPLEYPKIVRQTEANAKLYLFGNTEDPEYQDTAPVDGIDDRRREVLLDLAVQFSPLLVLNSTMIPMDFRLFMEHEKVCFLSIDRWDVSSEPPKRVGSETINWQLILHPTSESGFRTSAADIEDCRLLSLLEEFEPFTPGAAYRSGAVGPGSTEHKVMFFDFPGNSEKTWKQEYVNQISKALPQMYEDFVKVFVHPFVESVNSSVPGRRAYEFVLQYWFFYPYNDGFNNHEGDWEHINVSIKPLNKLHEPLSEADVHRILMEGVPSNTAPDRLVIQKVDYYFHHKVMTLDYTRPNVYQPWDKWDTELENTKEEYNDEKWIWKQIRKRAYWDKEEKIINTHPIGFIGGDNKGVDQLLKRPGGSNRVSNGTYPFRGIYKNVGQAGAVEQISELFDHQKSFADVDNPKRSVSKKTDWRGSRFNSGSPQSKRYVFKKGYRRGSVVSFLSPDRIDILPDAERVKDLVKANAQVRRDWAWLILPIRWGYPATESPFAGVVAHTDLGNISVLGPSYNAGWNRSGDAPGFQQYLPHIFSPHFRLDWQDNFANYLGYLNLPVSLLAAMPPLDVGWRAISWPLRSVPELKWPDRIFYSSESIPSRALSWGLLGVRYMIVDPIFLNIALNPTQFDDLSYRWTNALHYGGPFVGEWVSFVKNPYMVHGEITLHLGERFVSQNSLHFGYPTIISERRLKNIDGVFQMSADLSFSEYSGSLRYNLTTGSFMIFAKGGYGWSWYRLKNVSTDGVPLPQPNSPWLNVPTLHFGGGIEWVPFRNLDAPPPFGTDIGIQVEALVYKHYLGIDIDTVLLTSSGYEFAKTVAAPPLITRYVFGLALMVGF